MRVGSGFDIHRFEDGEYLTLGGVKIPFSKALRAHSDGDVLVHSLIDAILGAINAGDIGAHFPDDDVQYKNANSLDLLQNIYKLMSSEGYFLLGFSRDAKTDSELIIHDLKGSTKKRNLKIKFLTEI